MMKSVQNIDGLRSGSTVKASMISWVNPYYVLFEFFVHFSDLLFNNVVKTELKLYITPKNDFAIPWAMISL